MSSEEVLKNILAKIEQLSAEKTSMDAEIEMFFYSMHALHHHRRFGGLSPKRLAKLSETCMYLLGNVDAESNSVKGSLSGDYYLIKADLESKDEHYFSALIHRSLGLKSPSETENMSLVQDLAMAIDCLQLGEMEIAHKRLVNFLEVEEIGTQNWFLAKINLLKIHRLWQERTECDRIILELQNGIDKDSNKENALRWNIFLYEISKGNSEVLSDISKMTKKKSGLYDPHLMLQIYALASAQGDKKIIQKAIGPKRLSYRKGMDIKHLSYFQPLVDLSEAQDVSLSMQVRNERIINAARGLEDIKDTFIKSLVTLAIIRWLHQHDLSEALELFMEIHERRSLRMSKGRSSEIVGLGADIFQGRDTIAALDGYAG